MSTKSKFRAQSEKKPQAFAVSIKQGENDQRKLAEVQFSPNVLNALTTQTFTNSLFGEIDFNQAVAVMKEKTEKIIAGDLDELESTLTAQVISLNAIFNTLARKSARSEYLNQMETNMRLALKAQAQCARTAEILAAIKNPPIIYAKQANIAQGHQQINNSNQTPAHAGKAIISSNELLSGESNATLDSRGETEASRINQELAAVGTFNGC